MQRVFIDPDKCTRCSNCNSSRACPVGAIFRIDDEDLALLSRNFAMDVVTAKHVVQLMPLS